mmetsp:Transcript_41205/g.60472  ORF Transcript_41205/g.60472 Transcript_41205/m.60472 type:complete len:204 (-) Transcript_41205:570-1181(-)
MKIRSIRQHRRKVYFNQSPTTSWIVRHCCLYGTAANWRPLPDLRRLNWKFGPHPSCRTTSTKAIAIAILSSCNHRPMGRMTVHQAPDARQFCICERLASRVLGMPRPSPRTASLISVLETAALAQTCATTNILDSSFISLTTSEYWAKACTKVDFASVLHVPRFQVMTPIPMSETERPGRFKRGWRNTCRKYAHIMWAVTPTL